MRAAVAISRISFVKILPRLASAAPFLRLMVDHLEWPDMATPRNCWRCSTSRDGLQEARRPGARHLPRQRRLCSNAFCRYAERRKGIGAIPAPRGETTPAVSRLRRTGEAHERDRDRNRPGDEQLVRRDAARRQARGAPERLRRADHRERGRAARGRLHHGRQRRQGQHHPRSHAHRLLVQAADRPLLLLRGGEEGPGDLHLQDRGGAEPRRPHRDSRTSSSPCPRWGR